MIPLFSAGDAPQQIGEIADPRPDPSLSSFHAPAYIAVGDKVYARSFLTGGLSYQIVEPVKVV
jgi:hypothetical protein